MDYPVRGRLNSIVGILVILALSAALGLVITLLSDQDVEPLEQATWLASRTPVTPTTAVTRAVVLLASPSSAALRRSVVLGVTPTPMAVRTVLPLRANTPSPALARLSATPGAEPRATRAEPGLELMAAVTPALPSATSLAPPTSQAATPLSIPTPTVVAPQLTIFETSPQSTPDVIPPTELATITNAQPPDLVRPGPDAAGNGVVLFTWLPTASLPPATGYEVVWWLPDEDPAAATGMAAPTTETSLQVNLDVLYGANALRSNRFYWTVLVVQTDPYARLTAPGQSTAWLYVYDSSEVPLLKP